MRNQAKSKKFLLPILVIAIVSILSGCRDEENACDEIFKSIDLSRLCEGRITLTLLERNSPYQFILNGKELTDVPSWSGGDGLKYFSFFDSVLLVNKKLHDLQIIDNFGCSKKYSVGFRQDINLELSIIINSQCNKRSGEFEVTGTGFTGARSFLFPFNQGTPVETGTPEKVRVKDLLPGRYFVIGRDEVGCNRIDFEIKNIKPEISLNIASVNPAVVTNSCSSNSMLTFTVTGGQPPFAVLITQENTPQCIPNFSGTSNWPCPFPFSYSSISFSDRIVASPGIKTFRVVDNNGCYSDPLTYTIPQIGAPILSVLSISADSQCPGGNGEVVLAATNVSGAPVFEHVNVKRQSSEKFVGLKGGINQFRVLSGTFESSNGGCPSEILNVEIPSVGSGISYHLDIKPILIKNCNSTGCHDGTLGATQDYRTYQIVKSAVQKIELRVRLRDMPPPSYPFSIPLTAEEQNKILCWIEEGAFNN